MLQLDLGAKRTQGWEGGGEGGYLPPLPLLTPEEKKKEKKKRKTQTSLKFWVGGWVGDVCVWGGREGRRRVVWCGVVWCERRSGTLIHVFYKHISYSIKQSQHYGVLNGLCARGAPARGGGREGGGGEGLLPKLKTPSSNPVSAAA